MPSFCLHGENHNIVQLDFAQRLYDAMGSENKTLRVLSAFEGGSEH
jgi:esterase/lipase